MNCYFHVEQPAVTQCSICGKGLCKECASKYKDVVCDDCIAKIDAEIVAEEAEEQAKKDRRFKIALVVNVITFIGMIFVSFAAPIDDPEVVGVAGFIIKVLGGMFLGLIMGMEFAGFVYAFGFVKKHVSLTGIFLIPFIGWGLVLAWFMLVLTAGMLVGPVQYLIELVKKIISLIEAKKTV